MSTFTSPTVTLNNDSEANFRQWVKAFGDALIAAGLVRTARSDAGIYAYATSEATNYPAIAAFDGSQNFIQSYTGADELEVSGAGTPEVNLTFPYSGYDQNGAKVYQTGSSQYSIVYYGANLWHLVDNYQGQTLYTAAGDTTGPYAAWQVAEYGVAPAPTVDWTGSGSPVNRARRWRSNAAPSVGAPQALFLYGGDDGTINKYQIWHTGEDGDIKSWKFQSSADGVTWTDRDTQTDIEVVSGLATYPLGGALTAPFYRLNVTKQRGSVNYCEVIEFHLVNNTTRLPLPTEKRPTGYTGEQYNYAETFRFDDDNQATFPVWLGVQYGRTNANKPGVLIYVGTEGTWARRKEHRIHFSGGVLPIRSTGGDGRVAVLVGYEEMYHSVVFCIERTRNADGSPSVEGVAINSSSWYYQDGYGWQYIPSASVLDLDGPNVVTPANAWSYLLPPGLTSGVDGSTVHLYSIYPFNIRQKPAFESMFLYFNPDITTGTVFEAPVYGQTRTLRACGPWIQTTSWGSMGFAVLWE